MSTNTDVNKINEQKSGDTVQQTCELRVFGTRGSSPKADSNFLNYGGNTSSYTVRTPGGSFIYLDAGSGIVNAANHRLSNQDVTGYTYLLLSHAHADHIQGLGMSNVGFSKVRVSMFADQSTLAGLRKYYDGTTTWPVSVDSMPALTLEKIADTNISIPAEKQLDSKTTLTCFPGNHPGGSTLYSIVMDTGFATRKVVYATDCEFDYVTTKTKGVVKNEDATNLKESYCSFIRDADVLIADAQFVEEEYMSDKFVVRGWGHAYLEQILHLASLSNVKKVVITHHGASTDAILSQKELYAKQYVASFGKLAPEVEFAKEGAVYRI